MSAPPGRLATIRPAEIRSTMRTPDGREARSILTLVHPPHTTAAMYQVQIQVGPERYTGIVGHADVDQAESIIDSTLLALLGVPGE